MSETVTYHSAPASEVVKLAAVHYNLYHIELVVVVADVCLVEHAIIVFINLQSLEGHILKYATNQNKDHHTYRNIETGEPPIKIKHG